MSALSKYKTYPEYKDSGVEWLGEIPSHWDIKRIQETANIINGFPFDSKNFNPDKGIPLVRIRDITSSTTEVFVEGYVPKESLITHNDILVGMDGDFNVSLWKGKTAALNQRVACIRSEKELQQFLYYLLPYNMKIINDLTYFTTVKHLSNTNIAKIIYAVPHDNSELAKVIDFLDHETAKIDQLIEKQQTLIELLKEKRQAVISHAVTKGLDPNVKMKDSGVEWLGEVPEHWYVTPLKYYSTMQGGFAFNSDMFVEEGIQVLRIGNVYQNTLSLERQPVFIKNELAQLFENFIVKNNDILMSLTGTLGKTDYGFAIKIESDEQYLLNQRVAKITPHYQKIDTNFLLYILWSDAYLSQLYALPSGTKQANLSNSDVLNICVTIPNSIEEQKKIAVFLANKNEKFQLLIEKAEQQIELMKERRTALISAAVTGKIDVRDWQPEQ
ncbi:restriction endonuclease subunit S [Wohlfahrtiimonas chitiniclastica]|uniref:restriction endonuclease subunit S n=1 Tax=Wohlfahrtiimonas chitiniclastica TaxID=400946 RepID=UPI001BCAFF47|nr:restriction endonuclease subunit S [Wohlfahrtiimonas chitiniclastica]MBS7821514.1 restriction endonuclease subunit S [Wohlfahrtiimonas chitiniclastica]